MRTCRTAGFLTAVVVAVCLASGSAVASPLDFSSTVSFGDSLSHNDVLARVYDNPEDLYGLDPMEAVFEKGAASGDVLVRYAVAGSLSRQILMQVLLYDSLRRKGRQEEATCISFEGGANDFLRSRAILAAYVPGESAEADRVVDGVMINTWLSLLWLYRASPGARFVVWTVPDVTVTPDVMDDGLSSAGQANLKAHIERANRFIRSFGRYDFIAVFDLYEAQRRLVTSPPSVGSHPLVGPPAKGGYDHLFADAVHPTAVANALIANTLIETLNGRWGGNVGQYADAELRALARVP